MNLTNAKSVTINNKTVERILINSKTVYNTIQMLLSTDKEHIKTDESAIVNIESNIKNKTIELWKVINMTRTSMGTQTTGSDGKTSWTYTGTGAGDVQFIATYDDIESNTVTIEDYTPVIMRAVLTADKTTIISGESVTLSCNYFDQYNELTADYYSSALHDGSTIVDMGGWECPDVFTVSGLSVGTHSFKVVVTNQDNSEVDSNIVSVVVEDSFDGMSLGLSAGSQILSYADEQSTPNSQYATVTAQLLDGQSSALVSGVPVVFGAYLNNILITGSEQTVNTDSNGQASYTYHSAGRGDVVVKAVPDNRTLLTKTFVVEDCFKYNHTDTTGWSTNNNPTVTTSDDGITITTSSNGEKALYYPELFTSNDDVEFSMTWVNGNKPTQALGIGFLRETDKDSTRAAGYSEDYFRYNFTGSGVNVTSSLNPNDVIKLQYKNGVCYLYKNDTLIGSATESIYDFYFGFYTNNGRSQTVKDIKIKPL